MTLIQTASVILMKLQLSDSMACNYNPNATDEGSCGTPTVYMTVMELLV